MRGQGLLVFGGGANPDLTSDICKNLGVKKGKVAVSRFSEGEIKVNIEENVRGKDVFVIQSTCPPTNENMMELLIMIDALKRASATRITAVVPYYGYARQDKKVQPRVPITAKLVANLLTTAGANRLLTMDLHAGQIQGFFDIPVDHLYAVNIFIEHYKRMDLSDVVTVSPDAGGIKTARAYAKRFESPLAIVDKRRISDDTAEVMNIMGEIRGKNVIIVDDLVATAGSLVEASEALRNAGARNVYGAVTHPVLSGPAKERIEQSCLKELAVTDTIPLKESQRNSKLKVLSVGPLLAEAIKRIHNAESVSSLFF